MITKTYSVKSISAYYLDLISDEPLYQKYTIFLILILRKAMLLINGLSLINIRAFGCLDLDYVVNSKSHELWCPALEHIKQESK